MRHLAGGVCVVSVGDGSKRSGLVATSVVSLAMDPPTLLVCVNRTSSTWPLIEQFRTFAVNLLTHRHLLLAQRFAGMGGVKGADRYVGFEWSRVATGAPILNDALVAIDCEVEELIERHTHGIVIGRVKAVTQAREDDVLVYLRGKYSSLGSAPSCAAVT